MGLILNNESDLTKEIERMDALIEKCKGDYFLIYGYQRKKEELEKQLSNLKNTKKA